AVKEIADKAREILRDESIYRGQAIKVSFEWARDNDSDRGYDPTQDCPHFMSLEGVKEDELIFGDTVMHGINIGLFTPIEQSEACRANKIPLKRGILLHGKY